MRSGDLSIPAASLGEAFPEIDRSWWTPYEATEDVHESIGERKKTRRKYTDEYKAGAVALVLVEGRSVSEASSNLGLHDSVLANWVRQAKADAGKGPAGALTTVEKEELTTLRKENHALRMERDILKKAAAFFAKENA